MFALIFTDCNPGPLALRPTVGQRGSKAASADASSLRPTVALGRP